MIAEFHNHWQEEYKIKTSEQLQSVIDKRNTRNEKNAQTQRHRNTVTDMDEVRADGDDDDEAGYSEDDYGEDENGAVSHSKRIQARSLNLTTGVVKRMESKEDGSLTATCRVGGHAQCSNIIPMPNGGTEGVAQHFLKYHTDLTVRIRALKVLPGVAKNPPDFMKESNWNDTHTHTHPYIHTLTIVSRTHTFHFH
jgi:hypothetical protein